MNKSAFLLGGLIIATLSADLAWAQKTGGPGIFTCVDRNGRRLTADRPIAECVDREQRELGPSGVVRRQIGPTLTEHERTAAEVVRRKETEERNRVLEERRRDRALTAHYPDKATHDIERTAAVQLVDDVTATAEKRIEELQAQRKTFETEMEFYARDPSKAPLSLRSRMAENQESINEQHRFIAGQAAEKRRVHQRFDLELAQLRKLWGPQQATAGNAPSGAAGASPAVAPASSLTPAPSGAGRVQSSPSSLFPSPDVPVVLRSHAS